MQKRPNDSTLFLTVYTYEGQVRHLEKAALKLIRGARAPRNRAEETADLRFTGLRLTGRAV